MNTSLVPMTTEKFRSTALAIPSVVDQFLATAPPSEKVKGGMDYLALQAEYARKIKSDAAVINAIEYGRLKLIARYGELNPAPSPEERGAMGGRGNKAITDDVRAFHPNTTTAYRKVASHKDKLEAYWLEREAKDSDEPISMRDFLRFANGAHVSKNSGLSEWYTPAEYIEAARLVMGGIDLDPATSEIAQQTVKAAAYYTEETNGLDKAWQGRVWLNPPYSADLVAKFTNKLFDHFEAKAIAAAIVLVNNATETKWFQRGLSLASTVCFPAGRVKFLDMEGNPGAPLQGQACLYFGERPTVFAEEFRVFGAILLGR